ncbi:MAG TPA: porin family protein [Anaeromyxobacter sp.]|nr:porin family protein [Anaeromyxobacter sp.]
MTSRSIIGLVLAALLAVPAAAQAQTRRSTSSSGSGIWLGGMLGLEAGGESGLQIRADGEVPLARLAPTLQLAGVGTISYAWLSHNTGVLELLPAARLNWAATPTVGAYGDVGLGLFSHSQHSHSDVGAVMRFAAGGYYEMNSITRLVAEMGLHPHFGDYSDTTFTLMLGVKFRL